MSKYNSQKITQDGICFDSKDEFKYYEALKDMKAKGLIHSFELQPKFTLIPSFKKNNKTYRAITYIADFIVYTLDGQEIVIDVKGMKTDVFKIKHKLFEYFYPDKTLKLVARSLKYGDRYGFIDYDELQKIRKKKRKR